MPLLRLALEAAETAAASEQGPSHHGSIMMPKDGRITEHLEIGLRS